MTGFHWSPEAVTELRRLKATKMTSKDMAVALLKAFPVEGASLTKIAVDNQLAKLKRKNALPGELSFRWHPDTLAKLQADYAAGMSNRDIADKYSGKVDGGRTITAEGLRSLAAKKKWKRDRAPVRVKPVIRAPRVLGIAAGEVKPPMPSRDVFALHPVETSKFVTLSERVGCAYVCGYAKGVALYCDDTPVDDAKPYCAGHRAIIYRPAQPKEVERMRKAKYYA